MMRQAPVDRVRWGVNYTPASGWFHSWQDFDIDAVRADLDSIASLGLDHIRIFPIWPLIQPSRTHIRKAGIRDVGRVVDAAAEVGLDVAVDGLQGHLSSFDFLPNWVTTWHRRNIFTDPDVVRAEAELVDALCRVVSQRSNTIGMTVGNETDQFALDRHPEPHCLTPAQMEEWLGRMLDTARSAWPQGMHQHSADDDVWFDDTSPTTPRHATRLGDVTTVHSWVFTRVAALYPEGHPAHAHFADYLVQLATAWADDPRRPVWLQEIGAPYPAVSARAAPDFLADSIMNTLDNDHLWGVTWWCSHDVERSLADFPELEYTLGLLGSDRSIKPIGRRFADLIAQERRAPTAHVVRGTAVVFDPDEGQFATDRSLTGPGSAVFHTWLDLAMTETRPALVRRSVADDSASLKARGIDHVVAPRAVRASIEAYAYSAAAPPGPKT